jgi:hypothetical protein
MGKITIKKEMANDLLLKLRFDIFFLVFLYLGMLTRRCPSGMAALPDCIIAVMACG